MRVEWWYQSYSLQKSKWTFFKNYFLKQLSWVLVQLIYCSKLKACPHVSCFTFWFLSLSVLQYGSKFVFFLDSAVSPFLRSSVPPFLFCVCSSCSKFVPHDFMVCPPFLYYCLVFWISSCCHFATGIFYFWSFNLKCSLFVVQPVYVWLPFNELYDNKAFNLLFNFVQPTVQTKRQSIYNATQ